ncbi:MAG: fibronectin type III domain-containing protein, partial [Candidatus Gracilibacteria bacterium]
SNPSPTTMDLTWTAPGDKGNTGTASSYDVRYSTTPITESNWGSATQTGGEPLPQIAGTVQSMTITNLLSGTQYYFAMKTTNTSAIISNLSNVASGTTTPKPDTTPPAYANPKVNSSTTNSISLWWIAPGDDGNAGTASSYDIRYVTPGPITGLNWESATQVVGEPVPQVAGTVQSMTVGELKSNTAYCFAIKTSDEVPNVSVLSNVANVMTLKDTTPPSAITTLATSDPTLTSIKLTWTAPGNNGNVGTASHYDVRYSTTPITESNWGSATQTGGEPLPQIAGTVQSMTISYLSSGITYYFAIKTKNTSSIISNLSNVASGTTTPKPDTTPPNIVTKITISNIDYTAVTLTWTAPGDDVNAGTASSYDIRYVTPGPITGLNWESATQVVGEPVPQVAGTVQSMTIGELKSETTYSFAMKTSDEVPNVSSLSNLVNVTTLKDMTPPAAITTLTASAPTLTSMKLTWTAPGDDGNIGTVASYDVRYSTSVITAENFASALPVQGTKPIPQVAGTSQSMVVNGLSNGTTYYFAIKTSDEVPNTSAISNIVNAKTLNSDKIAPAAITNLATSAPTLTSIKLSWTAPGNDANVGKATSYDVRYSTSAITAANWASATQAKGEPAPRIAGASQSMVVKGLSNGTKYYFAMKTLDAVPNVSTISNVAGGKTLVPSTKIKP